MAGLSLQGLADRLEGALSRQALHKYEQGMTYPNSKMLIALSKVLGVPVDFFFSEPEVSVNLSGVEFRKRKRLSVSDEAAVVEQCSEIISRYLTLERTVNDEKPLRPFEYNHLIETALDAENAAIELRKQWGLGNDPIPNVVAMLEESGYKLVELSSFQDFDGMKAFAGQVRIIAVNCSNDVCRIRFTALHELAHHVLSFPEYLSENEKERLCHAFAGAVLLPGEQAREAMNEQRFHFYLPELVLLKSYWGISIAAMFARAKNLGIINDAVYGKLNQGYRIRQYHLDEPGKFRGDEKTFRFDQMLFKALAEGIITVNQAASLRNVTVGELRNDLDQLA
ncbi:MAG: helix-turn-helix domain-containing protein [Bacteroidales bacterium]|nr:helix-turn-helix domain-containing protein [Bacteroidales bacterium]